MKCKIKIEFEIDTNEYSRFELESIQDVEEFVRDMILGNESFPQDIEVNQNTIKVEKQ